MPEESIFAKALDIKSVEARTAFLDQHCGDNHALRAEVEALLQAHQRSGDLLDLPEEPAVSSTLAQPLPILPGTMIGHYKLLQQIGEGGMGVVYMAEQMQPVHRKVALKIIKPGLDSRQVIARFEAERQALAMMDHVNIARVIDGGTVSSPLSPTGRGAGGEGISPEPGGVSPGSGRPYFVMELINGIPITKYCDDNHLTPRERLELFVPVCQAVQHAHQKGIIHRDIKPSNVLVTLYDGKPVPKVIDFGVAKAIDQKLTDNTLFTNFGAIVGTLEYMSPEQAEMSNLGVDTRSDIYSLGVLLYELLTGSTPLKRKRLKEAANLEILRMIKEEEPQKPSTRLSESGNALASISAMRKTEPAKLSKLMRGELDWIVMKTLEKDRNRRYETANGLAVDVQRYLADETVHACPPSVGYRLHKFVRRNKVPVLAAGLVLLVLVAGVIGTALGLIEASRQRDGALAAKETAEQREAETKAVLEFVENKVIAAARPKGQGGGQGYDVKLADALRTALPFVDKSFTDKPLIEARLRVTLGQSFNSLGEAKIAVQQLEIARTIYTKELGPDHPDTLTGMGSLANSYHDLGRRAEALKLREETLALRKAKLGPDHPDTLVSMDNLANSYRDLGRHAEALKLHEETLTLQKAKLGPDHPDTLASMNNLTINYAFLGRTADALKLGEETLARMKTTFGPDHPKTLGMMINVANCYGELGRNADALKLGEETLPLMKAKFGPNHPHTLGSMNRVALSYHDLGRYADALKLYDETLALMKAKLGPGHPATLSIMNDLAECYQALDQHAEALKLHEETLSLRKAKLGPDHPDTLISMHMLANSYSVVSKHAETVELLAPIEATTRKVFVAGNAWRLAQLLMTLGIARARLGKFEPAEANLVEALPLFVQTRGPTHKDTRECTQALVDLYTTWHVALPGKGYDIKAAAWKTKLDAVPPQIMSRIPEKTK